MKLYSDTTHLLLRSWEANRNVAHKHANYYLLYDEKRAELEDQGFGFEWDFEEMISSEEKLRENSVINPEEEGSNQWDNFYKGSGFLPRPYFNGGTFIELCLSVQFGFDQTLDGDEAWFDNVANEPRWFLDQDHRFWFGMAERIQILMGQILCAQNLANLFRLDARGRPH